MAIHVVNMYPVNNYAMRFQEPQEEQKDDSLSHHLLSLGRSFESEGMRTTVKGILLAHNANDPCIFLLRRGNLYKLPGGRLRPGENEKDCLERKLSGYLGASSVLPKWRIGECVATWWRPDFDRYIVTDEDYIETDGYIETAKEQMKHFLVNLLETAEFDVPPYYELFPYRLVDLAAYVQIFGPLSFLAQQLNQRCDFNMIPG